MTYFHHRSHGFTLIELLVVVAIISVLLAMLAPALDKAVYQAELTVCGANQRAVGTSVAVYASSYKRYYPFREGVRKDTVWPEACIYNGNAAFQAFANGAQADTNATNVTVYNDKPLLRSFLSLNHHLIDPMVKKVSYDISDNDAHNYSTYNLWFGYQFWEKGGQTFRGMKKIGDRVTYFDTGRNTLWRLDILASDRDTINNNADPQKRVVQSSHPDRDGRGTNKHLQNTDWAAGMKFVASWWESNTGRSTEGVDLNFAYQDGSVGRFGHELWKDYNPHDDTDLTTFGRVPESNLGFQGWWVTVPAQK